MHSWVFRNRARLKAIFGPPPASEPEHTPPAPAEGAEDGAPRRRRRLAGTRSARARQGTVDRRARHVLLRPMPPPES